MKYVKTFSEAILVDGITEYLKGKGYKPGNITKTHPYLVIDGNTFYTQNVKPHANQIDIATVFTLKEVKPDTLTTPNFKVKNRGNDLYSVSWETDAQNFTKANLEEIITFFKNGFSFNSHEIKEVTVGCARVTAEDVHMLEAFLK